MMRRAAPKALAERPLALGIASPDDQAHLRKVALLGQSRTWLYYRTV
jgi:hypothetical protein